MLVATDPFRDFDRLAQQVWGTTARPAAMPMDAWRDGEQIVVAWTSVSGTALGDRGRRSSSGR